MSRRRVDDSDGRFGALADAAVVIATFVALGIAGALLWHAVVHLPTFVRAGGGGQMGEEQLAGLISIDGWYAAIGGGAALIAGVVLMLTRARRPVMTVALVFVAACVAAVIMLYLGRWLGPPDPGPVLRHAADGTEVPVRLWPHTLAVAMVWPFAAVAGALLVLLVVTPSNDDTGGRPAR